MKMKTRLGRSALVRKKRCVLVRSNCEFSFKDAVEASEKTTSVRMSEKKKEKLEKPGAHAFLFSSHTVTDQNPILHSSITIATRRFYISPELNFSAFFNCLVLVRFSGRLLF